MSAEDFRALSRRLCTVATACEHVTTSVTLHGSDMRGHAADIRDLLAKFSVLTGCLERINELYEEEKARAARLAEELSNIANARPDTWGEESDQFQAWAQNRARFALSATKDQSGSSQKKEPERFHDSAILDYLDRVDWHGGRIGPHMGGEDTAIQVHTLPKASGRGIRAVVGDLMRRYPEGVR